MATTIIGFGLTSLLQRQAFEDYCRRPDALAVLSQRVRLAVPIWEGKCPKEMRNSQWFSQ